MRFLSLSTLALSILFTSVHANDRCVPSPKVTPKLQYDFTIALKFDPTIDLGTGIYSADQSYLPGSGGTFCAKWNGGTTGKVLAGGIGLYYHTLNSTGPYKLDFQYLLVTNDSPPAHILVKQNGWEVNYVGRTNYVLETGDSRYSFLNTGVWIGVETGYIANATGTFSSVDGYLLA